MTATLPPTPPPPKPHLNPTSGAPRTPKELANAPAVTLLAEVRILFGTWSGGNDGSLTGVDPPGTQAVDDDEHLDYPCA